MHDVNLSAFASALKIQVSGATADLLHTLRGYVLTCRGTLNVKVTSAAGTPRGGASGTSEWKSQQRLIWKEMQNMFWDGEKQGVSGVSSLFTHRLFHPFVSSLKQPDCGGGVYISIPKDHTHFTDTRDVLLGLASAAALCPLQNPNGFI